MSDSSIFALHGFAGGPALWTLLPGIGNDDLACPFIPGHGESPLAESEGFEDVLDRLAELAANSSRQPRRLLGYSMGARLGLGLLVRHPGLFEEAFLVGVNPGLGSHDREMRGIQDRLWAVALRRQGLGFFYEKWATMAVLKPAAPLGPEAEHVRALSREGHDAEGLARAMTQLGLGAMPDYRPRLEEIEIPVSLVVGSEDAKFLALAREMVSSMQRARLVVVPGAGHNVVLEQPEALAALLGAEHES